MTAPASPDRQRAARITLAVLTEDKPAANAAITETAEDGAPALARVVAVLAGDLAALMQVTHGDDAADQVRRYLLDLAAHE